MSRRSILIMAAAGMTIMALTACGIVGDSRETSSIFGAVTEFASELKDGVFQEIRRRLPGAGEDSGGGTAQEGGTEKDPEDRQQEKLAELGQETLTVEEGEIRMESETEGEADLMVRLPDYEALFLEALNAEDPDAYLENALENGDYETKQVETRWFILRRQQRKRWKRNWSRPLQLWRGRRMSNEKLASYCSGSYSQLRGSFDGSRSRFGRGVRKRIYGRSGRVYCGEISSAGK